jgi:hypothetical protein
MEMKRIEIRKAAARFRAVMILLSLLQPAATLWAGTDDPVLVIRPEGREFRQVVSGLRDETSGAFEIFELTVDSTTTVTGLARAVERQRPRAMVLMDNQAIKLHRTWYRRDTAARSAIPVIALMAISVQEAIGGFRNAAAITYEVPILTSIVNLRSIIGRPLRRVGVIHRPLMEGFVRRNAEYCTREHVELINQIVPDDIASRRRRLERSLKQLLAKDDVDALWIPNDNVLLTADLINTVWVPLLKRYRVPVVVGVPVFVQPDLDFGTFAVLPDHVALGAQAADILFDARGNGWNLEHRSVEPPLSVRKIVNRVQAERHFGFTESHTDHVDSCLVRKKSGGVPATLVASREGRELSLGELLNMQITSVSKRAEPLRDAAASIYVITRDDIRRFPGHRLQDLLTLVPGAWVNNLTYWEPSTAIRSAASTYTTTQNVQYDGVPIINPIVGSVHYSGLSLPLSQIERIEVIKGPGGTIYGANSASGIINIETRPPDKGLELHVDGGTRTYLAPTLRYGSTLGRRMEASAFVALENHSGYPHNPAFLGDTVRAPGPDGSDTLVVNRFGDEDDGWRQALNAQGKLNIALGESGTLQWNLWAMLTRGKSYSTLTYPFPEDLTIDDVQNALAAGGKPRPDSVWLENTWSRLVVVSGRYDHRFKDNHSLFLQTYYQEGRGRASMPGMGSFLPGVRIAELEIQDNLTFFEGRPFRLELISGANVRPVFFDVDVEQPSRQRLTPARSLEHLAAIFVQDKLSWRDKIDLTTGIKAETWTLIGLEPELMPSVRLAVKPNQDLTAWTAWSRSVNTAAYSQARAEAWQQPLPPGDGLGRLFYGPLGLDLDSVPAGAGKWLAMVSDPDLQPMEFKTFEGGARTSLIPNTFIDVSAHYTWLHGAINAVPIDSTFSRVIPSKIAAGDSVVPVYLTNTHEGPMYGAEALLRFTPHERALLECSYAWLRRRRQGLAIPGTDEVYPSNRADRQTTPEHVVRWRMYLDLPYKIGVAIDGLWHSAFNNASPYDFIRQQPPIDPSDGVEQPFEGPPGRLNLQISKSFMNNRVSFFAWGRDILQDHTVQCYSPIVIAYPHTASRTFGAGVTMRIR